MKTVSPVDDDQDLATKAYVQMSGGGGGGAGITVSATAPASPSAGDLWFDSNAGKIFIYYDSFWVDPAIGGSQGDPGRFQTSSTAPTSPVAGDAWFNSDTGEIFIYYDGVWVTPSVIAAIPAGTASTITGTNSEGSSSNFARADHNHALGTGVVGTTALASGAVTATKAATGSASAITGTNAEGTSSNLARADHNHQIKATGAFYANRTTVQNITQGQWIKILFTAERFDVNSWFNTTTSEYTPQVAGYYRVSAGIGFPDGANQYYMMLYKNGSEHVLLDAKRSDGGGNGGRRTTGSALVEMNGTTDYLDIRVYHSAGAPLDAGGGWAATNAATIFFCGEYVGAA